jgi:glycosyltransferase involved in cell wall biosynthesis
MVVSLLLEEIPHYREAFLDGLHSRLLTEGISLRVYYGRARHAPSEPAKDWVRRVPTFAGRLFNLDFVLQRAFGSVAECDLVIVEQANRHLVNYALHARRFVSGNRLAYWGHGRNLQSPAPRGVRERLKVSLLRQVDWWFAYTEATRAYLIERRYPTECITVVNNSQDDVVLRNGLDSCRLLGREAVRERLGCGSGPIALYCGRLSDLKRIDFLLAAAKRIRALQPTFELLIVGDGPNRPAVESAAKQFPWLHYVGPVVDASRAQYWYAADVALIPGAVGLVIVDSFITGCPLVTTAHASHGPEFTYLKSGYNGIASTGDLHAYVHDVVSLLCHRERLRQLQVGCAESAGRYSLERMIENFVTGTLACLSTSRKTRLNIAHT